MSLIYSWLNLEMERVTNTFDLNQIQKLKSASHSYALALRLPLEYLLSEANAQMGMLAPDWSLLIELLRHLDLLVHSLNDFKLMGQADTRNSDTVNYLKNYPCHTSLQNELRPLSVTHSDFCCQNSTRSTMLNLLSLN
jgi:hypothetical protein